MTVTKKYLMKKYGLDFNNKNFKYAECSTCTDKLGLDTYKKTGGFFTEYSTINSFRRYG